MMAFMGVGVAGVVVLHEVVAVDADAQVVALADFAAVEEGEVAGEGEQDAAADDAEVAPDGAAEVGGDHDVDFAGFDGLVALELVVEADEFELDLVVELEAADDFADGVDDGAGGAAEVVAFAEGEVVVEVADAEAGVGVDPVFFVAGEVAAEDGVGEVAFLEAGEVVEVVVDDLFHGEVDVVDEVGAELAGDEEVGGGADLGDGGEVAVGEHADFEVEVDFAGAEGVLLFGDAVVFDDAQADILAPGPLFEQADLDGAGGDADGLAVEGGVVVGDDGGVVLGGVEVVVLEAHGLVGEEEGLGALLGVADFVVDVGVAVLELADAVEEVVAGDEFDVPSGVGGDGLDEVVGVAGDGLAVFVDDHLAVEFLAGDAHGLAGLLLGGAEGPGEQQERREGEEPGGRAHLWFVHSRQPMSGGRKSQAGLR